jgi:THO complex subunit 5
MQRQKLTKECDVLESARDKITEEINKQQSKLDGVAPLLEKIIEATVPAQEFFDEDLSARKWLHDAAEYLPSPLYVLYVCSIGYEEFLGK